MDKDKVDIYLYNPKTKQRATLTNNKLTIYKRIKIGGEIKVVSIESNYTNDWIKISKNAYINAKYDEYIKLVLNDAK